MRLLALGGARSGKSAFAEGWVRARAEALGPGAARVYLATAEAWDAEMTERIARHRLDRGEGWRTIETPRGLGATLAAESRPDTVVLVDCLTLWLSTLLLADDASALEAEIEAFFAALAAARGPVALVSNEVGLGIVPDNALARQFRDLQGKVNRRAAAAVETVAFVAAGLPLALKGAL